MVHETKTKNDDLIKGVVYSYNEFYPVKATKEWIKISKINTGALFRSIDLHGNIKERLSDNP
ncbi:hypothetical protein AB9M92_07440 [Peribacillus frigoritolerans]|uniref:hypothetical protein n=1 Tax=Peribacillus frigoritolerans TaxID=450367 RepID=UPI003512BE78